MISEACIQKCNVHLIDSNIEGFHDPPLISTLARPLRPHFHPRPAATQKSIHIAALHENRAVTRLLLLPPGARVLQPCSATCTSTTPSPWPGRTSPPPRSAPRLPRDTITASRRPVRCFLFMAAWMLAEVSAKPGVLTN